MKNFFTLSALLLMCGFAGYAQEPEAPVAETSEPEVIELKLLEPEVIRPAITEPEFIGEVYVIYPDGTVVQLEKTTVQFVTRLNASAHIVGIGKARTRITVPGTSAEIRLPASDEFQFIVRAVDNNTDPLSIIDIFRFDTNKKERRAELASASTFGSVKSNNMDFLPFTAKKYGATSYLITLNEKSTGEYGIIVRNPNALDERSTVVSSFAIVE